MRPIQALALLLAALGVAAGFLALFDVLYDVRPEVDALAPFYASLERQLLIVALLFIVATLAFLLHQVTALREELEERRRRDLLNPGESAAGTVVLDPSNGGPMLKAVALRKVYDTGSVRVEALRGIDLEIRKGEMVVVMGPSGCGKTTLLNCLSGLDDVTSGEVYVAGNRLSDLSDDERTDYRAARMGFVFQSYNLIPVLSVVENVEVPLLVAGVDPKEARRTALDALAAVGLEAEVLRRPMEMSGGQQQRAAIARAIANTPEVVFADEPTGNLDSETSGEVVALLGHLNRSRSLTLVVVTHDPALTGYADRILTLRDGAIAEERQVQEA